MEKTKELILKDLCARQYYGVKVCYEHPKTYQDAIKEVTYDTNMHELVYYHHGRPYLRSLSTMTEEEEKELIRILDNMTNITYSSYLYQDYPGKLLDFYNKRHLDYRGLIEKRLALEAPKDMYDIK